MSISLEVNENPHTKPGHKPSYAPQEMKACLAALWKRMRRWAGTNPLNAADLWTCHYRGTEAHLRKLPERVCQADGRRFDDMIGWLSPGVVMVWERIGPIVEYERGLRLEEPDYYMSAVNLTENVRYGATRTTQTASDR